MACRGDMRTRSREAWATWRGLAEASGATAARDVYVCPSCTPRAPRTWRGDHMVSETRALDMAHNLLDFSGFDCGDRHPSRTAGCSDITRPAESRRRSSSRSTEVRRNGAAPASSVMSPRLMIPRAGGRPVRRNDSEIWPEARQLEQRGRLRPRAR